MKFTEIKLKGAFVIEPDRFDDERGFFSRTWDRKEYLEQGLSVDFSQFNLAYNHKAATLRGMHFQIAPHGEVKLVRCTRGAVYDVIVDLRKDSPTYTQWEGVELTADNYKTYYVPRGFAHGYVTLVDNSEVAYQVSDPYAPAAGRGVRWSDPVFGIKWPHEVKIVNPRDNTYPDFDPKIGVK